MKMSMISVEKFLCLCAFTMNVVGFLVYPVLPIYLRDHLLLPVGLIGIIIGAGTAVSRMLPLAGGYVADLIGNRTAIALALMLRLVGFGSLVFTSGFKSALAAMLTIGLGGALFEPSLKGLIGRMELNEREKIFLDLNYYLNFGVVAGPLLGIGAAMIDIRFPFIASAMMLAILLVFIFWHFNQLSDESSKTITPSFSPRLLLTPFITPRFLPFFVISIVISALLSLIYYAVPFYSYETSGIVGSSNLIYIVNGVAGVCAMALLKKRIEGRKPIIVLSSGLFCLALGLGLIPAFSGSAWLVACVVVFTVGETLILPTIDIHVSRLAGERSANMFFGAIEMGVGFGATLGVSVGPALAQAAVQTQILWVAIGCVALMIIPILPLIMRTSEECETGKITNEVNLS